MKPMIVVPPGTMTGEDMDRLRENGVCVVEAKDPAAVRFLDPIPVQSSRTEIEAAAVQLSRRLIRGEGVELGQVRHSTINAMFIECLTKGTPLQAGPTDAEREAAHFTAAKRDELTRLAREEARAERAAAKAKAPAEGVTAARPPSGTVGERAGK